MTRGTSAPSMRLLSPMRPGGTVESGRRWRGKPLAASLAFLLVVACGEGGAQLPAGSAASARTEPAPPPPAPQDWREHEPAGWQTVTDQTWTQVEPWSYRARSSEVVIVPDPDEGSAAEFRYPAGFVNARDVAFLGHYGVQGAGGFYVALRVQLSPGWTHQDPLTKVMHVMGEDWNVFLAANHPSPSWTKFYGPNAGQWTLSTTGWGGEVDGLPEVDQPRELREPWNNVTPDAARIRPGVWQTLEIAFVRSTPGRHDGSIRQWVDGVLTAEHTAVRTPAGGLANLHFAGTWGGGRLPQVPSAQWFRLSRTYISIPR